MGLFAFLGTVLYVPFLSAGATVPRWAFFAVALPAVLLWKDVDIPVRAALLAVAVGLTLFWSPNTNDGLFFYGQFLIGVAAFCLGRSLTDLRPIFIGVALALWANSLVVLGQLADVLPDRMFTGVTWASGLFGNYVPAGEAAAMVAIALVAYRLWWLIPGLLPSLAFPRGPVVALGVVGSLMLWRISRRGTAFVLLLTALLFGAMFWRQGFSTASFQQRLDMWRDVLPGLTWWGHGIGSFDFLYPTFQTHTNALQVRIEHPHNDLLNVLFEFGAAGGLFVALVVRRCWRVDPGPELYSFVVFVVCGTVSFPMFTPITWVLACLCLGCVYGDGYTLRHPVDVGGTGVFARGEDARSGAV